jgi:hypothetical protein
LFLSRAVSRAVGILIPVQLTALACGVASDAPARKADSARTERVAPPSLDADADTVGCEFAAVMTHPDPDSLLREFVRRDSAGQFTQSSEWFTRAVDCPGHEPGPDVATAIRGVEIRQFGRDSTSLRAEVRWARAEEPGTLVETLTVRHTRYGWRIQSPALNPKVPGR